MGESRSFGERRDRSLMDKKLALLKAILADLEESIMVFRAESGRSQELENQLRRSLISSFSQTIESVWRFIKFIARTEYKEMLEYPLDCFKFAFRRGWVPDEDMWKDILELRNTSTRVYSKTTSKKYTKEILDTYYPEIKRLIEVLENA